jgi:type IV pilus assembly protein PilA
MKRTGERGITLIELMAVVAIIGVLATLAVVGYRAFATSSKTSEAAHNVLGIMEAQERYKAEKNSYADISSTIKSFYPAATPGNFKTAWGAACTVCNTDKSFDTISFRTADPVFFGYATVADTGAKDPAGRNVSLQLKNGTTMDFVAINNGPIKQAWFVAYASRDSNEDGSIDKDDVKVIGHSFNNQLFIEE